MLPFFLSLSREKTGLEENLLNFHQILSKLTLCSALLYLSVELIEFTLEYSSLYYRKSHIFFFIEMGFFFMILIFDLYFLKKRKFQRTPLQLTVKFLLNLIMIILFTEIRVDVLGFNKPTYHHIQFTYLKFWLIAFSFSLYILNKPLRYLLVFLEYSYFKYRILTIMYFDSYFLLENLTVIIICTLFYNFEKKIQRIVMDFLQEIENYKTLFKLADLSTEGMAIINSDKEILYSSTGFNKYLLNTSKEENKQTTHSINEIFAKGIGKKIKKIKNIDQNDDIKNIDTSTMKLLNLTNLKNIRVFKELEDMNISSPIKMMHENKEQANTLNTIINNSLISDHKKMTSLQETHLLINEGVDSEENLLLKLNRNNIKSSLKTLKKPYALKPLTITIEKDKTSIYLKDIIQKLLNSEIIGESAETLLPNASGIELIFNQSIMSKSQFKIFQFEQFFGTKTSSSKVLHIDQKPHVYFFQEEISQAYYSIVLIPFRFLETKGVFISLKSLFQEIFSYYMEKIEAFQEKFIRTMSHELRTPINGSLALLEEINKGFSSSSSSSDNLKIYLNPAICNLKIFHNTVNDIFDFSKIFLKKFQLTYQDFQLKVFISDILALIKPLIIRKNLEIQLDFDENNLPKRILSDPKRIRQILLNLLTNSIRYTNKGSILVTIRPFGLDHNKAIEFSVKDTGIGITPSKKLTLLKMNLEKEGTIGFGLTISNLLAIELNNMKNGLIIESEEGKGCHVSFIVSPLEELSSLGGSMDMNEMLENNENTISLKELDLEKKFIDYIRNKSEGVQDIDLHKIDKNIEISEIHRSFVNTKPMIKHKKCSCFDVLIADDNEFNLIALKLLLEKFKLKVDQARNGEEAINKIVHNLERIGQEPHLCPYKLIFMDLDMPIKNGFEACEELMVIFSNFDINIPIIACTAFQENEKERCLNIGMNAFLTKPINLMDLEQILSEWFID